MSRRDAREKVIQALYQLDFHRDRCDLPDDWLNGLRERDLLFYRELLTGVRNRLDELDQMIRPALKGWTLERLSAVDRAILRLGTYELSERDDIPPNVTLNEAVELAKRFSTDEAARFINGVLSQIRRNLEER